MEWSLSDLRDVADVLESGEYYLEANVIRKFASDVADFAKRCIPVTRSSIEALEGLGFGAILEKQLLIDLEQIVEESA